MTNMICKKCESRINLGSKCFQCGHDNNSVPETASAASSKRRRINPAVIGIMVLFTIISVIIILSMIGVMTRNIALANITYVFSFIFRIPFGGFFFSIPGVPMPLMLAALITVAASVLDIVLCAKIIQRKQQAFKAYAILAVVGAGFQVINIIGWAVMGGIGAWFFSTLFNRMFPYLVKGVLLFVVYRLHIAESGGASFGEKMSVRKAREKRERGGGDDL